MMQKYDVAVIGGGPAGMMAAGRAAESGARVILVEKNEKLGKKLALTGGGRCNLANNAGDTRSLVAKYGKGGRALFSAFSRFGIEETLNFFQGHGVDTKTEPGNRVFPTSDSAQDVVEMLIKYMRSGRVDLKLKTAVLGIEAEGDSILSIPTSRGQVKASAYVLASGGKSHPETGSTGECFEWLKKIGHSVMEPDLALVPVKTAESWSHKLQGIALDKAAVTVFQNEKKIDRRSGKLLFTHFGLSGPLVLNMSKDIRDLMKYGPVRLEIDLDPENDLAGTDRKILDLLGRDQNKKVKNILDGFVPAALASAVTLQSGVDPEIFANALPKEKRRALATAMKGMPANVTGFLGYEKSIVSSGGIVPREVDFKTMRSKKFGNLYLAGDVLDFNRPSGGFSLQICWTTGYLAGENAAASASAAPGR